MNEIDPHCCCCGEPESNHSSEHGFIPWGCVCGFLDQSKVKRNGSPDYPGSLDAMHEAEKTLTREQAIYYRINLMRNSDGPKRTFDTVEAALCHATAFQRALALVLTHEPDFKL